VLSACVNWRPEDSQNSEQLTEENEIDLECDRSGSGRMKNVVVPSSSEFIADEDSLTQR
jgi:hypothetical protein